MNNIGALFDFTGRFFDSGRFFDLSLFSCVRRPRYRDWSADISSFACLTPDSVPPLPCGVLATPALVSLLDQVGGGLHQFSATQRR
jgi:hypothetical protein